MPNTKWNCIYRGNANVYVKLMRRIANKKIKYESQVPTCKHVLYYDCYWLYECNKILKMIVIMIQKCRLFKCFSNYAFSELTVSMSACPPSDCAQTER